MKQVLECCLLSLSLFLFFSCGKEEEGPIPTDRQVPIGVMEASLSTRVSTRGVINTDIYKLGIFRTNANGYPPQYDAPYSYKAAGWTASTEILVDHRSASLYAYYPYQSVSFADNTTKAILVARIYDAAKDMCYGSATSADGSGMINNDHKGVRFIDMKHAYARLRLTLTRGEKFDKTKKCNIQNITFKSNNANFYLTRSLDIASTAGATGGSAVAAGYVHNPNVNIATGKSVTYEYMFPPQPLAGSKLTILVTVDGVTRSCDISTLGSSLDSGKYYGVSLTFTDVGIILSSAVVTVNNFGGQGNTQVDTEL